MNGLSLDYCDSDSTKVSFMLHILGMNPSISAKVKVFSIRGCRLTVEIDDGLAVVNESPNVHMTGEGLIR